MKTALEKRPEPSEYADYYDRYVSLVPDGDIVTILRKQMETSVTLLKVLPSELGDHTYAPGKWTLKEVLGHVVDIEWVFTYRALCFARDSATSLPGVDQDALVRHANFSSRTLADMVEEFRHLRLANTVLFSSFGEEVLDRRGVASDCTFSVRSFPYIIAGHELHHMNVIKERYL